MTAFLIVPLADKMHEALERLAAQSAGRTPEILAAEAIETFVKAREEARRRVADAEFLFDRRNRAR